MAITKKELQTQLDSYRRQLAATQSMTQQSLGAISVLESQIKQLNALELANAHRQKMLRESENKQPGESDAVEKREQPESDSSEHQSGDSSGKEPEASGSDSLQQSGKIEEEIIN